MPQDDIKSLLGSAQADNNAKAEAWDVYHTVNDKAEFQKRIGALNLPNETKARMWDMKWSQPVAPAKLAPVAPAPQDTLGQQILNSPVGDALSFINDYAIKPFENAATAGREFGHGLAQQGEFEVNRGGQVIPTRDKLSPSEQGVQEAVGEFIGGTAADPRNYPFFGMPAAQVGKMAGRRAMAAGFTGLMAKGTIDEAAEVGAHWDDPGPEGQRERARGVAGLILGTTTAGLASHGVVEKAPAVLPERAQTMAKPTTVEADNANLAAAGMKPTEKFTPPSAPKTPEATPQATVSAGGNGALSSEELNRGNHVLLDKSGNIKQFLGKQPDLSRAQPEATSNKAVVELAPDNSIKRVVSNNTGLSDSELMASNSDKVKAQFIKPDEKPSKPLSAAETSSAVDEAINSLKPQAPKNAPPRTVPAEVTADREARSTPRLDAERSSETRQSLFAARDAAEKAAADLSSAKSKKAPANQVSFLEQELARKKAAYLGAFDTHIAGLGEMSASKMWTDLKGRAADQRKSIASIDDIFTNDMQASGLRKLLADPFLGKEQRSKIHSLLGDTVSAEKRVKVLKYVKGASMQARVAAAHEAIRSYIPQLSDPKEISKWEKYLKQNVVFTDRMLRAPVLKTPDGVKVQAAVPEMTHRFLKAFAEKTFKTKEEGRTFLEHIRKELSTKAEHNEFLARRLEGKGAHLPKVKQLLTDTKDITKVSDEDLRFLLDKQKDVSGFIGQNRITKAVAKMQAELARRQTEKVASEAKARAERENAAKQPPPAPPRPALPQGAPVTRYFDGKFQDLPQAKDYANRLATMTKKQVNAEKNKISAGLQQFDVSTLTPEQRAKNTILAKATAIERRLAEFPAPRKVKTAEEKQFEKKNKIAPEPSGPTVGSSVQGTLPSGVKVKGVVESITSDGKFKITDSSGRKFVVDRAGVLSADVTAAGSPKPKEAALAPPPKKQRAKSLSDDISWYNDRLADPSLIKKSVVAEDRLMVPTGGSRLSGEITGLKDPQKALDSIKGKPGFENARLQEGSVVWGKNIDWYNTKEEDLGRQLGYSEDVLMHGPSLNEKKQKPPVVETPSPKAEVVEASRLPEAARKEPVAAPSKPSSEDISAMQAMAEEIQPRHHEDVRKFLREIPVAKRVEAMKAGVAAYKNALANRTDLLPMTEFGRAVYPFIDEKPPVSSGGGVAKVATQDGLKKELSEAGLKQADIDRAVDSNPKDEKAALRALYKDRVAQQIQILRMQDMTKAILPDDPKLMAQLKGIITVSEKHGIRAEEMIRINNELIKASEPKQKAMGAAVGNVAKAEHPLDAKFRRDYEVGLPKKRSEPLGKIIEIRNTESVRSFQDLNKIVPTEPVVEAPAPTRTPLSDAAIDAVHDAKRLAASVPDTGSSIIDGQIKTLVKAGVARERIAFVWQKAYQVYAEGLKAKDPMALRKALDTISASNNGTTLKSDFFGIGSALDKATEFPREQLPVAAPALKAVQDARKTFEERTPSILDKIRQLPYETIVKFKDQLLHLNMEPGRFWRMFAPDIVQGFSDRLGRKLTTDENPYIEARLTYGGGGGPVLSSATNISRMMREATNSGLLDNVKAYLDAQGYDRAIRNVQQKVVEFSLKASELKAEAGFLREEIQTGGEPQSSMREYYKLLDRSKEANRQAKDFKEKLKTGTVVPMGLTRQAVAQQLRLMKEALGPEDYARVEKMAGVVWKENGEAWDALHSAGVISEAVYQKGVELGPSYIPLRRLMDVIQQPNTYIGNKGNALELRTRKALQFLEGSSKINVDPLEASLNQIQLGYREAQKNQVARMVANLKNLDPEGFGTVMWELPPGEQPPKGMSTISFYEDGQPVTYAVPEFLGRTIKMATPADASIVGGALFNFTKDIFQKGTTLANLRFALPNVLRDVQEFSVLSKAGAQGPLSLAKMAVQWANSLKERIAEDPTYHEFLRSRAAFSTLQRNISPETSLQNFRLPIVDSLRETAKGVVTLRPIKTAKEIINTIEDFNNALEETTKLTAYKRMREDGWSAKDAAWETRNYGGSPDFGRRGQLSPMMNLMFMFFNAGLEGTARTIKRLATDPKRLGAVLGAYSLAAMTQYSWNSQYVNDDGTREMDHISDTDKKNYFYVIRPETYQTSQGNIRHRVWKFPKPHVARLLYNPIEDAIDDYVTNKIDLGQTTLDTVSNLLPGQYNLQQGRLAETASRGTISTLNPILQEPIEQAMNYDSYRGIPIEERALDGKEMPERRDPTTSITAQKVAKIIYDNTGQEQGLSRAPFVGPMLTSPKRLEHAVSGFTGGLGEDVLGITDSLLGQDKSLGVPLEGDERVARQAVVGGIARRFVGSTLDQIEKREEEKFYSFADRTRTFHDTYNMLAKRAPEQAEAYINDPKKQMLIVGHGALLNGQKAISDLRNQQIQVMQDQTLSPADKKQIIRDLHDSRMEILKVYNNDVIPALQENMPAVP